MPRELNGVGLPVVAPANIATPASGYSTLFEDSAQLLPSWKDSSGNQHFLRPDLGGTPAVAAQTITSTASPGTLITGSTITFPANAVVSGLIARVTMYFTCSSTVAPVVIQGHFGTAGNQVDTVVLNTAASSFNAGSTTAYIRFVAECTFRGTNSIATLWYYQNNTSMVMGSLNTNTSLVTTSLDYFTMSAYSNGVANNMVIQQCIPELLST